MSNFKAKMHQIRFLACVRLSVRPLFHSSLRWSLTLTLYHTSWHSVNSDQVCLSQERFNVGYSAVCLFVWPLNLVGHRHGRKWQKCGANTRAATRAPALGGLHVVQKCQHANSFTTVHVVTCWYTMWLKNASRYQITRLLRRGWSVSVQPQFPVLIRCTL